jgi:hypothetical protein
MITTEERQKIDHDLLLDLLFHITVVSVSGFIGLIVFIYHHETIFPLIQRNFLSESNKQVSLIVLTAIAGLICYWPFKNSASKSRRADEMSDYGIYTYDDIRKEIGLSYDRRNLTPQHRPDEKEIHSPKSK